MNSSLNTEGLFKIYDEIDNTKTIEGLEDIIANLMIDLDEDSAGPLTILINNRKLIEK